LKSMNAAPDMRVSIGGLHLKNPVMTASGTFGYAAEFNDLVDLNRIGAIIVKGLSLSPSRGNPPPRIAETASGMLNAIGLENIGIEAFAVEKLPFLKTLDTPTVANIYGTTVEEYAELAARIDALEAVAGIEINISCPNVKAGGIAFGVDPKAAFRVVSAVRKRTTLPLIVKLSPNVTDITVIAKNAVDAGADALSLINTLTGMAVDIGTRRPKLSNITGGLSGPAIKPIALRMVWQVVHCVNVPVIGIGGIATATDALEFLMVGATAVQVGTANFINPRATTEIVDGIEAFLAQHDILDIHAFIGSMAKS
jgi:dihydroorotate dehydrogenase (NAD+) catalytic subunit